MVELSGCSKWLPLQMVHKDTSQSEAEEQEGLFYQGLEGYAANDINGRLELFLGLWLQLWLLQSCFGCHWSVCNTCPRTTLIYCGKSSNRLATGMGGWP